MRHGNAGSPNVQIETHDGAAQAVGDEKFRCTSFVNQCRIPRTFNRGIHDAWFEHSVLVDHQDGSVGSAVASSVGRREVPNQYESIPQNIQRGGESQRRSPSEELKHRLSWRHVNDSRPGALKTRTTVEVRNENITGIDRPSRRKTWRYESHPVR